MKLFIHLGLPRTGTHNIRFHLWEKHPQINYLGRFQRGSGEKHLELTELIEKLRYIQEYLESGSVGSAKMELEMLITELHRYHMGGTIYEGKPFPQDTPNEFAYLDFKKWAYKHRGQYKKDIQAVGDDRNKKWEIITRWWVEWAKRTNNKEWSFITDTQKFGRALAIMMKNDT